jgi:hypothetical protein
MIEANKEKYGNQADFFTADITRTVFVKLDVILCRTVLFHLSLKNAMKALNNFRKSGSRYLLLTHHPWEEVNHDIKDGAWRRLNLCLAPFNLPEPKEMIQDGGDGYLGLWDMEAE